MANVAVTGGSGFIGSHVVDALVDAGHKVTVIDHRIRPHRDDVSFEDVDLMDLSSVLSALRGAEHVFHLAAVPYDRLPPIHSSTPANAPC